MRISCGTGTGEVMCLWGPDCSLPASSHKLTEGDASCWGEKRKHAYVQITQVQIECKKIRVFLFHHENSQAMEQTVWRSYSISLPVGFQGAAG